MQDNTNHFNAAANTWDTDEAILRTSVFAAALKKHLVDQKVSKILDFGCGTGLLAEHFLDICPHILGIDTSQGMLEKFILRFKNQPHVECLALNLEQEPLPHEIGSFDVIMSSMAFHHLKNPKNILELLKKTLKPQGVIFIIDLDQEDGTFHPDNKSMGVEHFGFSSEELESWAKQLDFKSFTHEIIFEIDKNNRTYRVGLGIFKS